MNVLFNQRFSLRVGVSIPLGLTLLVALAACQSDSTPLANATPGGTPSGTQVGANQASPAVCGAGDKPETGLQGQVPLADRESGRSEQGYSCNMELVGQYQGEGATWVNPSYSHCAYMGTTFTGILQKKSQGVQVVDVSNPSKPVLSTNLTSPAF